MNMGTAGSKECNPASKPPAEDCLESPRQEDRASTTSYTEDVNLTDGNGWSPLHHAAMDGDVERMRELIGRGTDTRLRDLWGRTPLHCALIMGKEAAAELLAEADGSNDVEDEDGFTPLHLSAEKGYVTIIGKLLAGGSRTRVQDVCGMTPLHRALLCGKQAAAELLTVADGTNDVEDEDGHTHLHLAARVGYVTIIRKLLAGGSGTRVQDKRGRTPLHLALQQWCWQEAAAELLAEADGSNDVQDEDGCTPLHRAAEREYAGTVRKLVQSGINPHIKDRSGAYPLKLALERWRRNDNIPKMILSSCALKGITIGWEELQLREKDLQFCIKELSRCEAEIRLMKRTLVPASSVSLHHLVTRHVGWVSSRFRGGVSRACQNFPVYADLIAFQLRKAEERRVLMDRCLDCFTLLAPPLPTTCVDIVLLCLSDGDLRNFVRAFRFDC